MNKVKITPEILKKVEACKNPEELVKVAKENNLKLSLDDAKALLAKNNGKLSEEDLDKISGGYIGFTMPVEYNGK